MITSLPFVLLVILVFAGIWFWIRKNKQPTADTYPNNSPSRCVVRPAKKDQPKEKSQTEQPAVAVAAAVPAATPAINERWCDWLALTTTIMAVVAVIMTLKVSQYSTLSLITQGKETNAWSYYQAKSIKANNCQMAKGALELQLAAIPGISAEAAENYRKAIKKYDDEIKRYKDEMEELQQQAEDLGKKRDKANKLAEGLDNSLGFVLMAIVLSSIATVVRKKYIWYISMTFLVGWLYFLITCF